MPRLLYVLYRSLTVVLLVKTPWQAHLVVLHSFWAVWSHYRMKSSTVRRGGRECVTHLHYIQESRLHTCIVSGGRHRLPSITQGQIFSIYHKLSNSQLGLELTLYINNCKPSWDSARHGSGTSRAVEMLRVYIIYDSRCLSHPHLIPRCSKKACNSLHTIPAWVLPSI